MTRTLKQTVVEPAKHGENGDTYTEVKIIRVVTDHRNKCLDYTVQYGKTVGGVWTPDPTDATKTFSIVNTPASPPDVVEDLAFDDLVTDDTLPTMAALYAELSSDYEAA